MVRETRHIRVTHVPGDCPEDAILTAFERFGRVEKVKVVPGKHGERYKEALVAFVDISSAIKAYDSGLRIMEASVDVFYQDGDLPPLRVRPDSATKILATGHGRSTASSISRSPSPSSQNRRIPPRTPSASPGSSEGSGSRQDLDQHEGSSSSSSSGSSSPDVGRNRLRDEGIDECFDDNDEGRPACVCCENLNVRSSDHSLKDALFHEFKKIGDIIAIKIFGQGPDRYGVIKFARPEHANRALQNNGKLFLGQELRVIMYKGDERIIEEAGTLYKDRRRQRLTPSQSALSDADIDPKATRTVFVGNIEKTTTYNDLRRVFDAYGDIVDIDIKKQTPGLTTYAFIQYIDAYSSIRARRAQDKNYLGKNRIKVGYGKGTPTNTIWIGNFLTTYNESQIQRLCQPYGYITRIHMDRLLHQALVCYDTIDAASYAFSALREKLVGSQTLLVDFASKDSKEKFFKRMERSGQPVPRSAELSPPPLIYSKGDRPYDGRDSCPQYGETGRGVSSGYGACSFDDYERELRRYGDRQQERERKRDLPEEDLRARLVRRRATTERRKTFSRESSVSVSEGDQYSYYGHCHDEDPPSVHKGRSYSSAKFTNHNSFDNPPADMDSDSGSDQLLKSKSRLLRAELREGGYTELHQKKVKRKRKDSGDDHVAINKRTRDEGRYLDSKAAEDPLMGNPAQSLPVLPRRHSSKLPHYDGQRNEDTHTLRLNLCDQEPTTSNSYSYSKPATSQSESGAPAGRRDTSGPRSPKARTVGDPRLLGLKLDGDRSFPTTADRPVVYDALRSKQLKSPPATELTPKHKSSDFVLGCGLPRNTSHPKDGGQGSSRMAGAVDDDWTGTSLMGRDPRRPEYRDTTRARSPPPPPPPPPAKEASHPERDSVVAVRPLATRSGNGPSASGHQPPSSSTETDLLGLLHLYPVVWQGLLTLKNDAAMVQMHKLTGNKKLVDATFPSLITNPPTIPTLRISQRMKLEPVQLDAVTKRMQNKAEFCLMLALPCGRDLTDVHNQTKALRQGFITYLQQKSAAGIINVDAPNATHPPVVLHIFPPCEFSRERFGQYAPDLLDTAADSHLMILLTSV